MGEGLFSFWHIAILAFVIFIVVGPKALVKQWHRATDGIQQLVEGGGSPQKTASAGGSSGSGGKRKRGFAYRVGRLFRRRKR